MSLDLLNSIFKVVIVHEDAGDGILAAEVLGRLAGRMGVQFETEINPWQLCSSVWQFNWLQDTELWTQAVEKATAADMIILSAGRHRELPSCVRSWIESALPRKQGLAVLVALLGRRRETHITALSPARYLQKLAEHHGVEFFCNLNKRPQNVEPGIESIPSRFIPSRFEDDSATWDETIPRNTDRQSWSISV